MNFDELKTIAKKRNRYSKISDGSMLVMVILGFMFICSWLNHMNKIAFVIFIAAMGVMFIINSVYVNRYSKVKSECGNLVKAMIMHIIEDYGIAPENYVITEIKQYSYIIGFHNQTIDYDVLNAKMNENLSIMNDIIKSQITVILI